MTNWMNGLRSELRRITQSAASQIDVRTLNFAHVEVVKKRLVRMRFKSEKDLSIVDAAEDSELRGEGNLEPGSAREIIKYSEPGSDATLAGLMIHRRSADFERMRQNNGKAVQRWFGPSAESGKGNKQNADLSKKIHKSIYNTPFEQDLSSDSDWRFKNRKFQEDLMSRCESSDEARHHSHIAPLIQAEASQLWLLQIDKQCTETTDNSLKSRITKAQRISQPDTQAIETLSQTNQPWIALLEDRSKRSTTQNSTGILPDSRCEPTLQSLNGAEEAGTSQAFYGISEMQNSLLEDLHLATIHFDVQPNIQTVAIDSNTEAIHCNAEGIMSFSTDANDAETRAATGNSRAEEISRTETTSVKWDAKHSKISANTVNPRIRRALKRDFQRSLLLNNEPVSITPMSYVQSISTKASKFLSLDESICTAPQQNYAY